MIRRIALVALATAGTTLLAQPQAPAISGAQFDVVSIKPHKDDPRAFIGTRYLPDGTFMLSNSPIVPIITYASEVPVVWSNIKGLPNWATTERFDIIGKPAPDSHPTRDQRNEMVRNMLIERFKLAGHIEDEEQTTFALVVVRNDGRLGPQLNKSSAECAPPSPNPDQPPQGNTVRCGMRAGPGTIEATGLTLDRLAVMLRGPADGQVTNRTGLDGLYDFSLHFSPQRLSAAAAPTDDAPQLVTAVQEQLGLKLVPEKTRVKVFVIDHIERPTPN